MEQGRPGRTRNADASGLRRIAPRGWPLSEAGKTRAHAVPYGFGSRGLPAPGNAKASVAEPSAFLQRGRANDAADPGGSREKSPIRQTRGPRRNAGIN